MAKKKIEKQQIVALDPVAYRELKKQEESIDANETEDTGKQDAGVLGLLLKTLKAQSAAQAERMSFETDPQQNQSGTMGFYKLKQSLTPDSVLRKISGAGGDELVCQILQARSNHIGSFGRPRPDRFSVGLEIQDMDKNKKLSEEEQVALQERISTVKETLWRCGKGQLDDELNQVNLSQFFKLITRDGLCYGRLACERLWWTNPKTGQKELYAWRASDAGTMYKVMPKKEQDQSIRMEAIRQLQELKNKKIDVEKYKKDEYRYVQVIDGSRPVQAFTEEEMVVYNLYPTTSVEHGGYPLTPIDQALNAITTHINITMHNKLYFQHGRAAKGMLIFKSDSVDEAAAQRIRLQFHQSINSVQNSWRMPVFGIQSDDELSWQSIDTQGRDAEFQYLMDNNARVILSAFQMSPEELPGYAHLARGTNTQALSESDNEWKLTASRDVGLRPLLHDIQDFMNTHILPFIDPELAKTHKIVLAGLEKDSPEKENTRIQQDMNIHLTYNEIMRQVEKNPLPKELGGEFPLNPQFQAVMDKYLTVGVILENFFGIKGAASDARYNYIRDPFYFQQTQMVLQKAQLALQQQQMVQQQMQQQAMAAQGITDGQDPDQDPNQEDQGQENPLPEQTSKHEKALDIVKDISAKNTNWATANYSVLEKTLKTNNDAITKQLLKRHKTMVDKHMEHWAEASKRELLAMEQALKDKK